MRFELFLSARPSLVGRSHERLRQVVLTRANGQCEFCGTKGFKKLVVVYATDTERAEASECGAACVVCEAILKGGLIGDQAAGSMVYLPEVSQAELVGLFYALEAWKVVGSQAEQGTLSVIQSRLNKRRGYVREALGTNGISVSHWKSVLAENSVVYSKRKVLLGDFRFLPDSESFIDHLESMKQGIFKHYSNANVIPNV